MQLIEKLSVITLVLVSIINLSGCSSPEQRAAVREREKRIKAYKIEQRERQAEQQEMGYREACAGYGYKANTPQFNQCVVTERRQYVAERNEEIAAAERQKLAKQANNLAQQANSRLLQRKRDCVYSKGGIWSRTRGKCI